MTRKITVIGAGGTIAMEGAHAFDWVDYGDTGIIHDAAEVIAGLDFGLPGVSITPHRFRALPSTGISPQDWLALRQEILTLCTGDAAPDGIVVTHGTATMEDTAFFLHATLAPSVPVVVVGAQRPPNTSGSDALPCLRAAIGCAAQLAPGVYLSMNGQVFDPIQVTKTSNHSLDAFEAPGTGPMGDVGADGAPRLTRSLVPPKRVFEPMSMPRVDLAFSYAGADGAAIDAYVAAGARAIVSIGLPPGRATPGERAAMERAVAEGVVVVQASRATRGMVPHQDWNARSGILSGGGLTPGKIRILLMLALGNGLTPDEIEPLLLSWTAL